MPAQSRTRRHNSSRVGHFRLEVPLSSSPLDSRAEKGQPGPLSAALEALVSPAFDHSGAAAAVELLEQAATPAEQRGIKRYDVLHGMLCSPEHTRAAILHDIREWLEARLTRSFDAPRFGTTMRRF